MCSSLCLIYSVSWRFEKCFYLKKKPVFCQVSMCPPLLAGERRCPRVSLFAHLSLCPKVFCPSFFTSVALNVFTGASASLCSSLLATVEPGASVKASLSVLTRHSAFYSVTASLPASASSPISPIVIASITALVSVSVSATVSTSC